MRFNDIFRNVQTILLILAILFGVWYYIKNEFYPEVAPSDPRAVVSHEIFSACLDAEHRWIRAMVEVRNVGLDPVELSEGRHSYAQLVPVDGELSDALDYGGSTDRSLAMIDWGRYLEASGTRSEIAASSTRRAASASIRSNESHRQYLDFVIAPSVEVFEISSAFTDASGSGAAGNWSGEATTIYEVKADPTCTE